MVGISGVKERGVELVKKDNYEIVVFSDWKNWETFFDKYINAEIEDKDRNIVQLRPEFQWQWKQNYPDLIVEDIIHNWHKNDLSNTHDIRNFLYDDLLYRGMNKWLFVRYLLIRYKKMVSEWRNDAWSKYYEYKKVSESFGSSRHQLSDDYGNYKYWEGYWKGYYDAMRKIRADLKTMCNTPRYVVWNNNRPGFAVDKKLSRGWLKLVKDLYTIRFEK